MSAPRVLVFGSRDWDDGALIHQRLRVFPRGTVVIHGAARGADSLAGHVAKGLGFEVVEEPAMWDVDGKSAGPKRNQRMLDLHRPTCGLGFMLGLTPGSSDMLRRLLGAGLPVDVCFRSSGN